MMLRCDRIDRVVDGALRHPQVDLESGRCSARRTRNLNERVHRDQVPPGHGIVGGLSMGRSGETAEHKDKGDGGDRNSHATRQ